MADRSCQKGCFNEQLLGEGGVGMDGVDKEGLGKEACTNMCTDGGGGANVARNALIEGVSPHVREVGIGSRNPGIAPDAGFTEGALAQLRALLG